MSSRGRAPLWLVALWSTTLAATLVLTVTPALSPVHAAPPPQYYAIAAGLTDGVAGIAMNEAGVVGGQFPTSGSQGLARVTGPVVEKVPLVGGFPMAINAIGSMVGLVSDGPQSAIRVDGTAVTVIPGLAGSAGDVAYDIDDTGTTVVGASFLPSESRSWTNDGIATTLLSSFGSDYELANRINNAGLIAGSARGTDGNMHLVAWQNGVIQDVGGGGYSSANVADMNEAGDVLGSVTIPPNTNRAILWDGTTATDLGTLPGGDWTSGVALNNSGGVLVSAHNAAGRFRAARWDGTGLIDLGTLPGDDQSFGSGINEQGQIVGLSIDATQTQVHGFLIDDGVMYDINDLLPPDSVEVRGANAIADSGHILASGPNGDLILLVPGPRPLAAYDVIDLGAGLADEIFEAFPADMNDSHQTTGAINRQAFRYDGSSSTFISEAPHQSAGRAINSAGVVVGNDSAGSGSQAFRYDGSAMLLGTLGGPSSFAWDINDAGDIVGWSDSTAGQHAFLYRNGTMTDIHTFPSGTSEARRVNQLGDVIGFHTFGGSSRGFVFDGLSMTDLGTLGGTATAPNAINDSGVIVGTSSTTSDPNQAFRYSGGTMTNITPPGFTSSEAIDINENGVIAGTYQEPDGDRRAFRLDGGTFDLIPGLGGSFATAIDINEAGQVVGYSTTEGGAGIRGYLFYDGELIDLTKHLPLGYEAVVEVAIQVADDGTILAKGRTANARDRAMLLVPTDAPPVSPLTIDTSRPAASSVAKFGRFEKEFTLNRAYAPDEIHDPAVIDVTATFRAPSGATYTVPAFFGSDYTVRPGTDNFELYDPVPGTEVGVWHARFSPDETGTWRYTLRAQDKRPGETSTEVSAQLTFSVTESSARGQVERDPRDSRFLRYSDGTPYYPMGHNVAFQQGEPLGLDGEHYVEPLFASMEAAGQNWTRIWMTDFNRNAIEWSTGHWADWYTGVGQYAGQSAFRIERQLDVAETHGLQVQLVINDHGQVSSRGLDRWHENPYNAANGWPGPRGQSGVVLHRPGGPRQLFKQRLRYLVARYGAYRNLLTWELFNEAQFVGSDAANPSNSEQVRDDIVAWHAEMAAYLRSIDPYDHLITTSSDIESSLADIWADPNIDLVQVHDYEPNLVNRDVRFRGYAENLNAAYGKPVIIGEFGLPGNPSPEINFDPVDAAPLDDREAHLLQATHLHNAAWASAMSGSGAMSWWWGAYIHSSPSEHRAPPDFPANERINPPLRDFFAGEDLAGMGLDVSSVTAPGNVVVLGLDNGSEGFAWIRDAQNEYGTGAGPGDIDGRTISGVSVAFAGFADGTYRIEVHDPWGVVPLDDSRLAVVNGGTLSVALPDFTRDLAIKIRPAGSATSEQPVTAAVISPVAGPITITEVSPPGPPPVGSGYTFVGTQLDIAAPAATTANPLTLVFTIDQATLASVDPDLTATTVSIFRNGILVSPCTTSGADDPATPDPCVALRETLSGGADQGDARVTVFSSAASSWTVGVGITVPGAPTGVTAIRGNAQAGVSWTAPADNGGSPITGYTVTASPGGQTATVGGATTNAVVTGLTNGTSYTFIVRATNATGTGPASAPSNAVTPGPQLNQTITFPNPGSKNLTQSPVTVAPTASSGLPVTLTSTTTTVCTVNGYVITLLIAGSCSITATQPGNLTYRPANPVTRTFTVTQVAQTITFANPGSKTMAQSPFTVTPTASSGLPVTLTSTTTAICTVSGFTVTLLGPGTCTLTATQPGNTVYRPANAVTRSFTVSKVAQSITFVKPPNSTLIQSPLTVAPTSSSGLTVTLASTTPAVCLVSGFDISLLATGTCTIRATQAGDVIYAAAPAVNRSFTVSKASQTITIPDPGPQSMLVRTVVLSPYASSGLPVTLSSLTTAVCTVSGDIVTLNRAGTCRIRGNQAGNAVYAAAPAVTRTITVTAATAMPFVVASGDALTVGGQPFRFHGAAIYNTSNPGAPNTPAQTIALTTQAGLNSLRIVNPFVEDGTDGGAPFATADWQRVDQLLARARGAGMRVVLDLSGFRNHLVNRDIAASPWADECEEEEPAGVDYAAIDPYRPGLEAEWEAFLDFVVGPDQLGERRPLSGRCDDRRHLDCRRAPGARVR